MKNGISDQRNRCARGPRDREGPKPRQVGSVSARPVVADEGEEKVLGGDGSLGGGIQGNCLRGSAWMFKLSEVFGNPKDT